MKRFLWLACMMFFCCVILTGCLPGDGTSTVDKTAGFFWGIWHGWVAPLSLIGSVFNKNINLYEVHNNGFWYNLGFYMAIISGFGGLALRRRRKKD